MSKMPGLVAAAALAIAAAGCGTSSPSMSSCSFGAGECWDYPPGSDVPTVTQACVNNIPVGQFVPAACTSTNRVGTCAGVASTVITGTLIRMYDPPYSITTADYRCSLYNGSTFTPN